MIDQVDQYWSLFAALMCASGIGFLIGLYIAKASVKNKLLILIDQTTLKINISSHLDEYSRGVIIDQLKKFRYSVITSDFE